MSRWKEGQQWLIAARFFFLVVFLWTAVTFREHPRSDLVLYAIRPGHLVALDPTDGQERSETSIPLTLVCDVVPAPSGQWVAAVGHVLVLVPVGEQTEPLVIEPPQGWFYTDCISPTAWFWAGGRLLAWADERTLLVLLRKNVAYPDVWALASFELDSQSWRPWVHEVPRGCDLLDQPVAGFQIRCVRLPGGRGPDELVGLRGIDALNGVVQRRLPVGLPPELRQQGLELGAPPVAVRQIRGVFYILLESGVLLIVDDKARQTATLVVWREAGLSERARGITLRLARDGSAAWVVLAGENDRLQISLLELRTQSVARTGELPARAIGLDFVDDGVVVMVLEQASGQRQVVRRELRTGAERILATLGEYEVCCWVGPLAREALGGQ
uniref:Uncharacterized protein n=1 Tax=Thermomicrobium roseum TaxID=500 RepID=A0A7C5RS19_THERO